MSGKGTESNPWTLSTPSGKGEYQAWLEPEADPPVVKVQVGKTWLTYRMEALDDLLAMLKKRGDWMVLGSADEQKDAKPDTVEAWGRSKKNPVGGWYGLRKGYRGRFANYVTPILEKRGDVEFEKQGRSMAVRAKGCHHTRW